jgi:hypothetical protein
VREQEVGVDHVKEIAELEAKKADVAAKLAALEKRFAEESRLVGEIREIRGQLTGHATLTAASPPVPAPAATAGSPAPAPAALAKPAAAPPSPCAAIAARSTRSDPLSTTSEIQRSV